MLTGMRWGDWVNLLRQRQSWQLAQEGPLLFRLSLQSLLNEGLYHLEERYLGGTVDAVSSAPPLMVLGFWRSGTSWLQQLLAQDPALAYPTALQAFNPHTFFFWQGRLENPRLHQLATACGRALWGQPKQRWKRPGDGLPAGLHLPEEDEVALSMFGISPRVRSYLSGLPKDFERYFTLRDLAPLEREHWKARWKRFVQKLSLFHKQRPLVLKSPHHTARLRTLLEIFPKARFVHIRRHPWDVYRSTVRFLQERRRLLPFSLPPDDVSEVTISMYQQTYSAYLEDRQLLGADQLYELSYEELLGSPISALRSVYEALGLGSFPQRPVQDYLQALGNYRPAQDPPLQSGLRTRLGLAWKPYFEAFGYPP